VSIAPAVPYRRHRRFLVAVLAVVLLIGPARAQIYRLVGAGNVSCGSWTADRQTPLNFGEINWVWASCPVSPTWESRRKGMIHCGAWTPRTLPAGWIATAEPILRNTSQMRRLRLSGSTRADRFAPAVPPGVRLQIIAAHMASSPNAITVAVIYGRIVSICTGVRSAGAARLARRNVSGRR